MAFRKQTPMAAQVLPQAFCQVLPRPAEVHMLLVICQRMRIEVVYALANTAAALAPASAANCPLNCVFACQQQ